MKRRIIIEQLAPGMVLDEPVKELYGRILMSKGDVITEKSIRILKMWGIIEVQIDQVDTENSDEQQAAVQIEPAILEAAEKEAEELFKFTDRSGKLTSELFRLATMVIARRKVKEMHGQVTV